MFRQCNLKEISDCKVVAGECVTRQPRMVGCRMTLVVRKMKMTKAEQRMKWWKLKDNKSCVAFKEELRQTLDGQEK